MSYTYGLIGLGLLAAGAAVLYRLALPRVIPGIPYNKENSHNILGDLPSMMKTVKRTENFFDWMVEQSDHFQAPVFQVMIQPFKLPMVVVADFREAQDIQMRRTPRDFDRSPFFADLFQGLVPHASSLEPTSDHFRVQRKVFQDTMSPAFLRNTAAPRLHGAFTSLIELWRIKASLAQGHPFLAMDDLSYSFLDAICEVAFDIRPGTIDAQIALLTSIGKLNVPADRDAPVDIPRTDDIRLFKAFATLTDTVTPMTTSPMPRLHHFILRQFPKYKAAKALTDGVISSMIGKSRERRTADGANAGVRSAIDLVLDRQHSTAEKTSFMLPEAALKDELFSFLTGGHETSTTTISWSLKLLADHPNIQQNLRTALQSSLSSSTSTSTNPLLPTAAEITKQHIPLLDATLEEIFRFAQIVPGNSRCAVHDTEILGHKIPKGTEVILLHCGPGYLQPALDVEEGRRSASCQGAKEKVTFWDAADVGTFRPERWLREEEGGKVVFDPNAGPNMPFGSGMRGCFGRKLAELQLHMLLTLIILNFELEKVPAGLSSYEGHLGVTRVPRQCYVRLRPL